MEEGKEGTIKRLLRLPLHKLGRVLPESPIRTEHPKVEMISGQVHRLKNEGSVRSRR